MVKVHEHQGSANEGVEWVGVGAVRDGVHHVPGAVVLQLVRDSVPVLALQEHPEPLGLLQRPLDARSPGLRGPGHVDGLVNSCDSTPVL